MMFVCAMLGNLTGFGGIVLRLLTWQSVLWQMPWMIGTFGTVALDALLAYQTVTFARASTPLSSGGEPLLEEGSCC